MSVNLGKNNLNFKATTIFFLQTIKTFSRSFSSENTGNFKQVVIYTDPLKQKNRCI